MALKVKTRSGVTPDTITDGVWRTCITQDRKTLAVDIWCEWDVVLPDGRVSTRSEPCDPAVRDEILALPNFDAALQKAADNTHPKVAP